MQSEDITQLVTPESKKCRWCGQEIRGNVYIRIHELNCAVESDVLDWAKQKAKTKQEELDTLVLRDRESS